MNQTCPVLTSPYIVELSLSSQSSLPFGGVYPIGLFKVNSVFQGVDLCLEVGAWDIFAVYPEVAGGGKGNEQFGCCHVSTW